jgi:hypothetical protein
VHLILNKLNESKSRYKGFLYGFVSFGFDLSLFNLIVSSFRSNSNMYSIYVFLPTVTNYFFSYKRYSESLVRTFPVDVFSSLITTLAGTIL